MSRGPAAAEGGQTVGALLDDAVRRLTVTGVDSARLDARVLIGHAMGLDAATLLAARERPVDEAVAGRIAALVERRAAREPVSHIVGAREFWSLDFRVTPDVLTPRPDSETLIEAALAWAKATGRVHDAMDVLDLGTGTGCLLLSLLSEWPAARGLGVDISGAALAVARANAEALGLAGRARFVAGDWTEGLDGPFDVIVANPPYIAEADIAGLDPEVARFEPRLALAGGTDGLDAYRALAPGAARVLADDGVLVLEVGAGQANAVAALLADAGMEVEGRRSDLGGVVRCLVAARRTMQKT